MPSEGQVGLGEFGQSADRPTAEAQAIAGDDTQTQSSDITLAETDGYIEGALQSIDYTLETTDEGDESPVIHVFARTADGTAEHIRVRGMRPYFYVPDDEVDSLLDDDRVTGSEPGFAAIDDTSVTRIYAQTPRDVGQLREGHTHYEADVRFPNRFLIDAGIKSGLRVPERRDDDGVIDVTFDEVEPAEVVADPRVFFFDIEVDDRRGFPEDGEEPIISIAAHDSAPDRYIVWLYEAPDGDGSIPKELDDFEPLVEGSSIEVRSFREEGAMLDDFLKYVEESNTDVMSGWNCLPADTPIQMADGSEKLIQDVEVGDRVVGDRDQQTTPATVEKTWQSRSNVLELELADGTHLKVSDEHRVMVGDDHDVEWKQGADIRPGDFVLKPRKLTVDDPIVPQLADLIPETRQRYGTKETIKQFLRGLPDHAYPELADLFDVSEATLRHYKPTVWTPDRCSRAAKRYDIPLPDGGVVYPQIGTELDEDISEDEVYQAGLILTDGSMSNRDGVRFYNTSIELHQQFDENPYLEPDGKGCFKQNVMNYCLMHALNGLGIPFGDKNAVPVDLSVIYQMPESYIAHFMAGVIDGDGCVSEDVTIAAKNPTTAKWYIKLLKRLGIYAEQSPNYVRVPRVERDIATLKETVLPLMNHPKKVRRLEQLEGGRSGRAENIPYALFEAERGTDSRRIGRDKHRRGINLKRNDTDLKAWEDYVFVKVVDSEEIGEQITYDLKTTTSNFLANSCLVHNCDDFDAPYLLDRLERLDGTSSFDLSMERLSRVDEVWRSNFGGPDIKGLVVFDLLYAYRRTQFTELDSYRLDDVGEVELGVGKERYPGSIGDLWEDDPERLLEYNVRDVELCVELNKKQEVIAFWDEVRQLVGCQLEDAPTPGDTVDMYILHKVHGEYVLPSRGRQEGEAYEGGAVFDPISGIRENVGVFDLAALYPNCMRTINASPETKVDPDAYDGETYRAPNGIHFRKEPDGIIRSMVEELLEERETKKQQRDNHDPDSAEYDRLNRQQQSVKVLTNSLYGTLGWSRFRLYDKDMGAAVTATGREVIAYTANVVEDIDKDVIYGDTDSCLIEIELGENITETVENGRSLEQTINESYLKFSEQELNAEEHYFEIEFEKLYRRFFQAGKKKRYAGHIVWSEGKEIDDIDITGFEYQRSDIAPITKEVQHEVLERIVREGDVESVKEYLYEIIERFEAGEFSPEEIAIPGGIGKRLGNYETDTAHVRGAKYANLLLGTNFNRGSKPKRLYLRKVHPDYFNRVEAERGESLTSNSLYQEFKKDPDVICFEYEDQLPDEFELDHSKMLDKTLKGPISRILEALDLTWDEVKAGQTQTGLGQF